MHARCRRPAGFTLVEALVSTSIIAVAGSAILLGIASSIDTTDEALARAIGQGLAQQLLDEIAGQPYVQDGASPYATPLEPSADDLGGPGRSRYAEIGDYHALVSQPPTDRWGIVVGCGDDRPVHRPVDFQPAAGYFHRWRQTVDVFYVSETDLATPLPAGSTSDFKAVHVRIFIDDPIRGPREVAHLKRAFAYVPPP